MNSKHRKLGSAAIQKYMDRIFKDAPDGETAPQALANPHEPPSRTARAKNPLFRSLMRRAPSALNLWCEDNEELLAENANGLVFANIGQRRTFTKRLYDQQPPAVHERYTRLAAAKAEEMKHDPDGVWK